MPAGDGTGPAGMGPMTGRAAGYCAGYTVPGYMNSVPRRGFGFGRGMGRGYGRGYGRGFVRAGAVPVNSQPYPYYNQDNYGSAEGEVEYLENTAKAIKEELADIQKRLDELKKDED